MQWLVCRRRRLSERTLRIIDAFSTILVAACSGFLVFTSFPGNGCPGAVVISTRVSRVMLEATPGKRYNGIGMAPRSLPAPGGFTMTCLTVPPDRFPGPRPRWPLDSSVPGWWLSLALSLVAATPASPAIGPSGPGVIANRGQVDTDVACYAPFAGGTAFFTDDAIVIDLHTTGIDHGFRERRGMDAGSRPIHGHVVRLSLGTAAGERVVEPCVPLTTRLHYFAGPSPDRWLIDVPVFEKVVYRNAWPGADLVVTPGGSGLRWEIVERAGAGRAQRRFECQGAEVVPDVDSTKRWITTTAGTLLLVEEPGRGWIELDHRRPASGGTEMSGLVAREEQEGGETQRGRGEARPDDPTALRWSSFLGGGSDEIGWALALDSDGNVVVTGLTLSVAFPTTIGAYDTSYNQFGDVFVCKLSATGDALMWGTFLGGSGTGFDYGYAVTLDAGGRPVVTGYTASSNFPTTAGAYDRTHDGGVDVFVSKLSADGASLVWSTFLGSADNDIGYAVALDAAGAVVVSGRTLSFDFPTTPGAYDTSANGEEDGFVAKLASGGESLLWSTLVGGSAYDAAEALAIDHLDRPVVAGYTASTDFPTTPGAHDPDWNGGLYDVVALVLEGDGSDLVWGTYLGGAETDFGNGLALDAGVDPVIVGETGSTDFPVTPGAYDESFNGSDDAFVTKLSGASGSLIWSTFIGGTVPFYETAFGVAVDGEGRPVVAGTTPADDFPTLPGAFDTSHNGLQDVFSARFSADGTTLLASTFLGGSGNDYAWFAGLTPAGEVVLTGDTGSADFPTTSGAVDTTFNGGDQDVWVARLALGTGTIDVEQPAAIPPRRLLAYPSPARDGARFAWTGSVPAPVSIALFDAGGREVWRYTAHAFEREIVWDGTDGEGRVLPGGVYFARLRGPDGLIGVTRVTVIR